VLVAKPFENPLRGVPLLSRPTFIRRQHPVDDPKTSALVGIQINPERDMQK
jgi:hypothetical protein